ncbi:holo-ACP synthase [Uliginosibacterium sp. H1]|uniref:holo-ACP synthase n=1 Tax=Uliginosibacterium sp. H1 TaxID=3114757 RepID=UPI002E176EEA|nr:holo-ACP synthase [Uliginosibacterium sp. H1]
MIFGIGTDIVSVARMRQALERHGNGFAEHILTDTERGEMARAPDAARFLAKRFAAKEAFAKAYGTGLRAPLTLHAVAVGHDELGKPSYVLNDVMQAAMVERALSSHLSISDEKEYVVAFAILESR